MRGEDQGEGSSDADSPKRQDGSPSPRPSPLGKGEGEATDLRLTVHRPGAGHTELHAARTSLGQAREIGPHSDVYSLGAILYFLLTARPPFFAETFEETLFQVLNADAPSPHLLNASVSRDLRNNLPEVSGKGAGQTLFHRASARR